MKDENKSVLGWAANRGAKIMTLCVGTHVRAVTPTILTGESLPWCEARTRLWEQGGSTFSPCTNSQVGLRCSNTGWPMYWEVGGRDRPSDTPPPSLKSTFFFSPSFLQNSGLTFLTSLKIKSPIECRTQTAYYYNYMCTSRFILFLWKSRVTYRLHKGS